MESSRALLLVAVAAAVAGLAAANFRDDCDIPWEPQNADFTSDGNGLTMKLVSNYSGCMLRTKKQFIYGTVSTLIQLVPGNSAGTVTTYYTSSVGDNHDEIDFEFLGNETGQPYTFHTNIYADGVGNKEMQFKPWFDPTTGYHNYTISWSPCMIVWYVDSVPIRVFRNYQSSKGVAYPTSRPMFAHSSIWEAGDWATQGGRVKTDWTKAPFVARYDNIHLDVCECSGYGGCATSCPAAASGACQLSPAELGQMHWVQNNYRIYDYCVDNKRWTNGQKPVECDLAQQY
ncbi:putative xyloglucan endotransglucosylase/hydrolase protein 12 [Dichanthelium oligosanthes]|uniref:Xyloglucan endotransglucosylase/hydrolase n=1 Tax=Dichanthelium oligosanthes TaxID=888268 RepID=A0A1E5WH30_9POAL|nr:putative xyloglucan endotransglucosylase/hydrolase protein 12 [Dichanthelium oligosanthes]